MASGDAFSKSVQTVIDSAGNGTVSVSPPGSVTWLITLVSLKVSTNVSEPTFELYEDGVSDLNFLEGSYSGSQDNSDTPHEVRPGQTLIGVWSAGDPGATATMRVRGVNK